MDSENLLIIGGILILGLILFLLVFVDMKSPDDRRNEFMLECIKIASSDDCKRVFDED